MTRTRHASVCPHDCPSACALDVTVDEGQIVDVALNEACLAVQESTIPDYDQGGVVRGPSGTRLAGIAPSNIYPTGDGSMVVIGAIGLGSLR